MLDAVLAGADAAGAGRPLWRRFSDAMPELAGARGASAYTLAGELAGKAVGTPGCPTGPASGW